MRRYISLCAWVPLAYAAEGHLFQPSHIELQFRLGVEAQFALHGAAFALASQGELEQYDIATAQLLARYVPGKIRDDIKIFAVNHAQNRVAACATPRGAFTESRVYILDALTLKALALFRTQWMGRPGAIAWSVDDSVIASAHGVSLRIADGQTNGERMRLGPMAAINDIAFSPENRYCACGCFRSVRPVMLLNTETFQPEREICLADDYDQSGANRVAWHPYGAVIAATSAHYRGYLVDTRSASQPQQIAADSSESLVFANDRELLIGGASDGAIKVFDLRMLREVDRLNGHYRAVKSLDISPETGQLISSSLDGVVQTWSRVSD